MARAYNTFTVGDLIRLKGSFMVKGKTDQQVKEVLKQLEYIEKLGATNPAMYGLNYLNTFCKDADKDLPLLKEKEINKAIYEHFSSLHEGLKEFQEKSFKKLEQETIGIKEDLLNHEKIEIDSKIEKIDKEIKKLDGNLESYRRNFDDCEARILTNTRSLEELETKKRHLDEDMKLLEPSIVTEIKKIIKEGTWGYLGFDIAKKEFKFYLTKDAICTYVNPSAGVNKSLNLGRFLLLVSTIGSLRVERLWDTVNDTTFHPHIRETSICWGNKKQVVESNHTTGRIFNNVLILNQLILEYCPDNPFRTFDKFSSFSRFKNLKFLLDNVPKDIAETILGEEINVIDTHLTNIPTIDLKGNFIIGANFKDLVMHNDRLAIVISTLEEECNISYISELETKEATVYYIDLQIPDLSEDLLKLLVKKGIINEQEKKTYEKDREGAINLEPVEDIPF